MSLLGALGFSTFNLPGWQKKKTDPFKGFKIGVQTYSFREFTFEEAIQKTRQLGLKYIEPYEDQFSFSSTEEEIAAALKVIESYGAKSVAYGVVGFDADEVKNRQLFEFGKKIGVESLSAHPTPEAFDSLEKLVAEYNINIAIHNHGPGSDYDKLQDVLNAVKDHHWRIGACVDTGHFLRSDEDPAMVIRELGKRVHGVHLKDVTQKKQESILGQGMLNLTEVFKALKAIKFSGPLSIEYEGSPENPSPDMEMGMKAILESLTQIS